MPARLELEKGTSCFLEIPPCSSFKLWLDEEEVPSLGELTGHHAEGNLMPRFVDVTRWIRGKSAVRVTLCFQNMGRHGFGSKVVLHRSRNVPVPELERDGDRVTLKWGGEKESLSFDLSRIRTARQEPAPKDSSGLDPWSEGARLYQVVEGKMDPGLLGDSDFKGPTESRQRACVAALSEPLSEVEEDLLVAAEDEDWLVRMLAVRSLGEHRSRKAVPLIRRILREETPEKIRNPDYPPRFRIKEMCLVALGKIADSSAVPEVAACLHADDFYGARRLAAQVLGFLNDRSVVELLKIWAKDSDPETAGAALRSLKRLG
ncbi:MAG: HEAT repeat domain-containing protein [Blastochloris sp.]|nr:HEAT repeat domain-containing protein [Blastochloris sp.]